MKRVRIIFFSLIPFHVSAVFFRARAVRETAGYLVGWVGWEGWKGWTAGATTAVLSRVTASQPNLNRIQFVTELCLPSQFQAPCTVGEQMRTGVWVWGECKSGNR